jgi:hypothetical protein
MPVRYELPLRNWQHDEMPPPETKQTISSSLPPVKIRRGTFGELTIHEVADYELENLAHGSPDSLYLNFAIFLLSMAVSFFVAVLTAVLSPRAFTVFVVITTVGFLMGIFLLIVWLKKRRSVSNLVREIRSRLPAEGVQEVSAVEPADIKRL